MCSSPQYKGYFMNYKRFVFIAGCNGWIFLSCVVFCFQNTCYDHKIEHLDEIRTDRFGKLQQKQSKFISVQSLVAVSIIDIHYLP